MGGPGSGNRYHRRTNKKTVAEDCLSLDANRWAREGILKAGVHSAGSWLWTYGRGGTFRVHYQADARDLSAPFVRLWYAWTWGSSPVPQSADYPVQLTTTRPRF